MKDKLRELADDWRSAADAHSEIGDQFAAEVGRVCATELLSIIDAEGDGGAVDRHDSDCATHNMPAFPNGECDCRIQRDLLNALNALEEFARDDGSLEEMRQVATVRAAIYSTHPARSGVVSDGQWGLIRKTLMHINAAHILGAEASPKAINEWRKWITAALPENQ